MRLFLIRSNLRKSAGFTLLEMLVVVLLVSLLASLLMQGFIYMSGTYHAVERRQARAQQQELFEGWLRDSVHGIVNGVDGESGKSAVFSGDASSFSAISLSPLAGLLQGSPAKISWSIEREGNQIVLRYGEAPLTGGVTHWHVIKEWPDTVTASWFYLHNSEWLESFPLQTSVFKRDEKNVLPRAIGLRVDTVPIPIELIISVRANSNIYSPPVIEGVF